MNERPVQRYDSEPAVRAVSRCRTTDRTLRNPFRKWPTALDNDGQSLFRFSAFVADDHRSGAVDDQGQTPWRANAPMKAFVEPVAGRNSSRSEVLTQARMSNTGHFR
ncbi:hypothetical protein [Pseudomonas glycinae]|uniref:hypothetical protein n=1 Tax=Pseudomonas glycinae TaxID=1785145 RepID=UPI00167D6ED4|nr:hypothetical protein [Pseudomonas glycinae]